MVPGESSALEVDFDDDINDLLTWDDIFWSWLMCKE
jgi:hypothetical protein